MSNNGFSIGSGLGLVAATIAILGVGWVANDTYDEMSELRENISEVDLKLDSMKTHVERFEELKVDIENAQKQIAGQQKKIDAQESAIEGVSFGAKAAVESKTSELESRLNTLEAALKSTPAESIGSGATIRRVSCIPLNERILLTGPKSYDFCESDWVLQIADVQKNGIVFGGSFYSSPRTITRTDWPDNCSLELMEIDLSDPKNLKADVRGKC